MMGADRSRPRLAVTDSSVTLHAAADTSDTVFVTTTNLRPINPDLGAVVWICSTQIMWQQTILYLARSKAEYDFQETKFVFVLDQLEIIISN